MVRVGRDFNDNLLPWAGNLPLGQVTQSPIQSGLEPPPPGMGSPP